MYINRITIENFRLYKNVSINFNSNDNKNIAIIIGDNGNGKTTLLNAIAWCLYGKESNTSKNKGLSLINNIARSNNDNKIEISIIMTDRQKNKFKITRTLNDNESKFNILYKSVDSNDYSEILDTNNFIEKHFPESIMHYFLFDGEMLEEYFQNDNEKIKKEVYNLSNIELLDKINTHTNVILREIKDKIKNKNIIDINNIDNEINKIRQNIDEQNKSLEKQKYDLKIAKENRDELREKLRGIPDISDKEKLLQQYENNLQNLKEDMGDAEIDTYSALIKEAPYIITIKESDEIASELSTKIDKGEIPPMYKKDFLKDILDNDMCICGRKLDEYSRNILINLYNNTNQETNISTDLSVLYHTLTGFNSHINNFISNMCKLHKSEEIIKNNYNETQSNIEKIQNEIAGYDNEKIKSWQQQLKDYDDEIDNCDITIGSIKNELKQLEKGLGDKNKEYNEAIKSNKETEIYKNDIEFINDIIKTVKILKDNITNDMKKKIEEETNKIFLDIIEKKQTFKEVNIGDDYSFSVKNINDEESLGTMSAGEQESLALSFIAALNDITEIDVPIIADTLLGRLDPNVKENIARIFHSIFTDTQVILLVTESEFTEEFKDKIEDKCSNIFKLIYHDCSNGAYTEVNKIE